MELQPLLQSDVMINDDYACLETDTLFFYYGYEFASATKTAASEDWDGEDTYGFYVANREGKQYGHGGIVYAIKGMFGQTCESGLLKGIGSYIEWSVTA